MVGYEPLSMDNCRRSCPDGRLQKGERYESSPINRWGLVDGLVMSDKMRV